jgi:hypothetical protein
MSLEQEVEQMEQKECCISMEQQLIITEIQGDTVTQTDTEIQGAREQPFVLTDEELMDVD